MTKQTDTPVLGSRKFPCHPKRSINKPSRVGIFSRRCPACKAHWVLHVEPSSMSERLGRPILRVRWDVR